MSKNDVEKCFLRHATSKIKKADDLFEIQTMGLEVKLWHQLPQSHILN